MTPRANPLARRSLLGLLAAAHGAQAQSLPSLLPRGQVSLLVPGPPGGPHPRWAERLALVVAPIAGQIQAEILGGADGVTAANRFGTQVVPDGRGLLVLAGAAVQARLAGDIRARFDHAGWLPVCASLGSAVLVGRGPLPARASGAVPLTVAVGGPEGSGVAALLALDLLGLPAVPLAGPAAPHWQDGSARAMLLSGPALPARLAGLGATPWFVLDAGAGERDPALPEVAALAELVQPQPLLAACRAAGAAARLLAALVLPALTSADQVALWRGAGQRWLEEEARGGTAEYGMAMPGAEAAAVLALLSPGSAAVLAYREWLLRRLGWQGQ